MSDAAIRQRERVCAVEGHVPGRAPVSTSGPLPLTLLAPRCERCGEALGPDWTLRRYGAASGYAPPSPAAHVALCAGDTVCSAVLANDIGDGALTRWDERTAHASVGDVRLEASA